MKLARKIHIAELDKPGDYCIAQGSVVIMACPVCAGIFVCKDHKVEKEEPLTLMPSVVGPETASTASNWQILAPCKHHFMVKDGESNP
jgi:hypothetical protein